jgi:Tfp pilus assembly protein PilN
MVVGLPATACRSLGLILPDTDASLLPSMIEAQLERRGIVVEKGKVPNFAWHMLAHNAGLTFVSVDVLASPFPQDLSVTHAANYTAALRMMQLPANDLVVIEEQGLLVLAANIQGKLWHSHIIGTAESTPADLARELELAKLSLEAQEGFGAVRGVALVGDRLAPLISVLKKWTAIPLSTVAALQPHRALKLDAFQKMLPPAVYEAQASRARRGLFLRVGVLTAILYVLIFGFGWFYLNTLKAKVEKAEAEIRRTSEPASEVRTTKQRWTALEPATNSQRYPMVLLSQITAIMPPSGIVLKRFDTKLNEISISGDARDAQTATLFLEDLKKHTKLKAYSWSMPVPSVKDKVASFKIQGKLE